MRVRNGMGLRPGAAAPDHLPPQPRTPVRIPEFAPGPTFPTSYATYPLAERNLLAVERDRVYTEQARRNTAIRRVRAAHGWGCARVSVSDDPSIPSATGAVKTDDPLRHRILPWPRELGSPRA